MVQIIHHIQGHEIYQYIDSQSEFGICKHCSGVYQIAQVTFPCSKSILFPGWWERAIENGQIFVEDQPISPFMITALF